MNNGARIALAVAGGYLLGRRKNLRLALGLALAGLTGRLIGSKGDLLQQGLKALSSSPEIEKITESLRGDLLEAGRAAAKSAMSKRVDSLSTRLHDRAESLRHPEQEEVAEEEEEEEEKPRRSKKGREKTAKSNGEAEPEEEEEEEEEYEDEDELEGEEEEEEEEEEEPPAKPRTRAPARSRAASSRTRPKPARARG